MMDLECEKESEQIAEPLKISFSLDNPQNHQMELFQDKKNEEIDDSNLNKKTKKQKNGKKKSKNTKHKSCYNPKVFNASQHLPKWGQLELIDAEPIRLTVTLKDIGLEGLDSYEPMKKQETKQVNVPKVEIKETINIKNNINNNNDILNEQMRMKKVQEAWIERKKLKKKINTYDPDIFINPEYAAKSQLQFEDAPPIKLNVQLKDIGLKGLDSFESNYTPINNNQETIQEIKPPRSPPKVTINENENNNELNEEMRMKKVQEAWKERKKIEKKFNTYNPLIFRLSYYSPKKKIKLKEAPPVKLTVSLKDIGLEGLDSLTPINKISNNKKNLQNEEAFEIKQPNEIPRCSNVRAKRKKINHFQNTSSLINTEA